MILTPCPYAPINVEQALSSAVRGFFSELTMIPLLVLVRQPLVTVPLVTMLTMIPLLVLVRQPLVTVPLVTMLTVTPLLVLVRQPLATVPLVTMLTMIPLLVLVRQPLSYRALSCHAGGDPPAVAGTTAPYLPCP